MSKENKIEFWFGGGFVSDTYSMEVDGVFYQIERRENDSRDEEQIAKDILKELGIDYNKKIIFKWDGCL